jgi:hypothetical protein
MRDSLADWHPTPQTDLAQALMIGFWWSSRMLRTIVEQPPRPRVKIEPPRPATFDQAIRWACRDG